MGEHVIRIGNTLHLYFPSHHLQATPMELDSQATTLQEPLDGPVATREVRERKEDGQDRDAGRDGRKGGLGRKMFE